MNTNMEIMGQLAVSTTISTQNVEQPKLEEKENKIEVEAKSSIDLSPAGQSISKIENLSEQKTDLMEKRNELINQALDGDKNLGEVEKELDTYNEKLAELDKEMATIIQDQKTSTQKEFITYNKEGKTNSSEKALELASEAEEEKQAELIQSIKNKLDGKVSLLKSEAKTASGVNKENKLKEVSQLENISAKILTDTNEKLSNFMNTMTA